MRAAKTRKCCSRIGFIGFLRLKATGDGRDEHDFIAILKGVGLAAEEANIFIVDVDVDEAAKISLLVLDLGGERGEVLVDISDEGGEVRGFAGKKLLAVGVADEGGGEDDFDSDGIAPWDSEWLVGGDQGGFVDPFEFAKVVGEVGEAGTDGAGVEVVESAGEGVSGF